MKQKKEDGRVEEEWRQKKRGQEEKSRNVRKRKIRARAIGRKK